MMMRCLLFVFCMPLFAADLPAPPAGYAWYEVPEIKAAFLKPDGWHAMSMVKNQVHGVFITKEALMPPARFDTGMTVNVIQNIRERHGVTPSQFAQLMREAARTEKEIIREWSKQMGPLQSLGFLFDEHDDGGTFRIFNLLIANNETGTLYVVIFEAPQEEWDAAFAIGEPILQKLYLDTGI